MKTRSRRVSMRFGLRLATAAIAAFVGILTGTAISAGFVTAAHVLNGLLR